MRSAFFVTISKFLHILRIFVVIYDDNIINSYNMKRFLLFILTSAIAFTCSGQGRIIEKSDNKRPVWVKRDNTDILKHSITVSSESITSVDDAKNKAFEALKSSIINTVTKYMMNTDIDGRSQEWIRQEVENSDYIKNISETTSVDTYWEHRKVKGEDIYIYYILYEFNDFEKKKIVLEIDSKNSSAIDELNKL